MAVCSALEYATQIWSADLCESLWERLQALLKALRIAMGCHSMASSDHLHQECKIREHCEMIRKQYVAACHIPGHPGQKHLLRPPDPLQRKKSLLVHKAEVYSFFNVPTIDEDTYKKVSKAIHTTEVTNAIANQSENKVLDAHPPAINKEELTLNRRAQARLSQLMSSYSSLLNSYRHRLEEKFPTPAQNVYNRPTPLNTCSPAQQTPMTLNQSTSGHIQSPTF